ncbi:hypothetical protein ElyMa_000994800 [Elysia marginata]|uniref:Uncharacterized protein n=1 Tax=Elysia marginata TaxID=1093978 RepID=A0AAV4HGZ2_9GAST|nr:hypothetical protein ElyMa_000994800 [Elysia marginata]
MRFFLSRFVIKHVNELPMFESYHKFIVKAEPTATLRFTGYEQLIGDMLITSHSLYAAAHVIFITHAVQR